MNNRSVLVSGASIAGPALAYWLRRYGFAVTVVEKAAAVRSGGYPIDIRGTAVEVVRRMGVLDRLRDKHIDTRALTFLEADGSPVVTLRPEELVGGNIERDLEVPRGDLTGILYDSIADDVEFRFNDSIAALEQDDRGVDVTFAGGDRCTFDLVVGADGLHSNTRSLVFEPEERYHHYLGFCFAGFTVPNEFGLSHEAMIWNAPGRGAALYAVRDQETVHGFLTFKQDEPPFTAFRDPVAQRELVASVFGADGWRVPRLVDAMRTADDLFFDVVSQIRMPRWSFGRVALVGDAAYAPSFRTGQGTSIALVGAYVLAGELATRDDHGTALAGYEATARPYVEANQALIDTGDSALFPTTVEALAQRNRTLRKLTTLPADTDRPAYTALTLPDYDPALLAR